MQRTHRIALALALACVVPRLAFGADQTVLGDTLQVKNPSTADKRKVVGKAKEQSSSDTIEGNPTASGGGATLTITANGGAPSSQTFNLPQGTSPATGKPYWSGDATKGFKYKDPKGENGPIKTAQIKKSGRGVFLIKAVGRGKFASITVLPPNPGTDGCILLQITGGDSYSVRFGALDGTITNKGALEYKHKKPTGEAICVIPPTTTTTLKSGCFEDWGDGTVRDTCTDLQWEKKTNTGGLHDVDTIYTWAGCCNGDCSTLANLCQPNPAAEATCLALADGGTGGCSVCSIGTCNVDPNGYGASTTVWDWLNQVNDANFSGHNDWRLPSESACNSCWAGFVPLACSSCDSHELESILLTPCSADPCIDPIFGPTRAGYYWSATTYDDAATQAWIVLFTTSEWSRVQGKQGGGDRCPVRAVRAGS